MHPAASVIFFTVATGAGYGLLALLGIGFAIGLVPPAPMLGALGPGVALGLVTAGLLSSTAHLGRPERAWRAFSQWRTSWLSREGIASVATYIPAAFFAIGWLSGQASAFTVLCGLLAAAGSIATVVTTGMIYASLKPVVQWHSHYTLPGYLIYAAMTGATLLTTVLHLFDAERQSIALIAVFATMCGWAWKTLAWRHDDALGMPVTANTATGLAGGAVRSIEWPHTEENYLLKEMGYRIARKHAVKLRRIVHILAFGIPAAALGLALVAGGDIAAAASCVAVLLQFSGMLVERWLFFAEAKHVVTLYYGR